jgi:hypothetical protein
MRTVLLTTLFSLCIIANGQPWEEHGPLKVPENGHYLEHEDGTGFFWPGCTAWMLPRLKPEDVDRYLTDRVEKKFNVIQFTANNMGRPNFNGEYPIKGEEGKNTRMHFRNPGKQNFRYGKFLGHRHNDRPNIIWVGSGEYHKPLSVMFPKNQRPMTGKHRSRLLAVINGIRETEPGTHLYTMHPISFMSSSDDFHHEGWYENALFARWTGMNYHKEVSVDDDWKQRYQAYWSVFAGGFGFTYGHKNLWRMEDKAGHPGVLPQHILDAPGSSSLMHLRALMESKHIRSRIPDPGLISSGSTGRDGGLSPDLRIPTSAADGSWAFVYSTWGSLIRVKMERLAGGTANAFWYNPRTGKWSDGGSDMDDKKPFETGIKSGRGAPDHFFDPPGKSRDGNDWILFVGSGILANQYTNAYEYDNQPKGIHR